MRQVRLPAGCCYPPTGDPASTTAEAAVGEEAGAQAGVAATAAEFDLEPDLNMLGHHAV